MFGFRKLRNNRHPILDWIDVWRQWEQIPGMESSDRTNRSLRFMKGKLSHVENLLLQQAGMAGGALPATFGEYPGVGKASEVFVRLALIDSFSVIDADHHGRVGVHADFQILNCQADGFELWVFDIGEEF